MALEKTTTNDKIEVLQLAAGYPVVQVRTATIIAEDGVTNLGTAANRWNNVYAANGTLRIAEQQYFFRVPDDRGDKAA